MKTEFTERLESLIKGAIHQINQYEGKMMYEFEQLESNHGNDIYTALIIRNSITQEIVFMEKSSVYKGTKDLDGHIEKIYSRLIISLIMYGIDASQRQLAEIPEHLKNRL